MSNPMQEEYAALARLYLWACDRLYAEFAWAYDAVSSGVSLGEWVQWRREVLSFVAGARVLEIGHGTGGLLVEMARTAETVVGLERSASMQRIAARRVAQGGAPACLVRAESQSIPFAPAAFDAVVATFPSLYIGEASTLAEIARVLKPGGRLIVAGLWVLPHGAFLRRLPLVYGGIPYPLMDRLGNQLIAAGLCPAFMQVHSSGADVGLLLAIRQEAP